MKKTIIQNFLLLFLCVSCFQVAFAQNSVDTLINKHQQYSNDVSGTDDLHSLVLEQNGEVSLQNTLTKFVQTIDDVHGCFLAFCQDEIDSLNQEISIQKEILKIAKSIQNEKQQIERKAKSSYKRASKNSK